MRSKLIRFTTVLLALLTALAATSTVAVAAPTVRGDAPAAPTVAGPPSAAAAFAGLPKLEIYGLFGKAKDGRTFSYTFSDPASAPPVPAQASPFCYWGAGNVSYNGRFNWSSTHSCSGAYGLVTHQSRLLRSSWSGWRAYSSWGNQGPTSSANITYYWSIHCSGGGTYDYKGGARVYASGIGQWSGESISNNQERRPCGTLA